MAGDFDVAVVGSGFGGSLMAMIAKRIGLSVILLERGQHPRFVIGESSTPLANLLLEELARRYDLPRLLPLCKWGSWQRTYPDISCGLKRGFTFYHHVHGRASEDDTSHRHQLLVAASPNDEIADMHWYRPEFDAFLVREAQALGVEYVDRAEFGRTTLGDNGVALEGRCLGLPLKVRARFLVDATGARGFLHHALSLPESPFETLPSTQGLYAHFTNVRRWEEIHPGDEAPPYPVDDAALHHVFEGGWIWVLRFNNGITSAGVAATDAMADELRLNEGATAWNRLMEGLPSVQEQFAVAQSVTPFMHAPRLSFRSDRVVGPCWARLPSAAGVVDPLLSTGFPLTLLGIARLADILASGWESRDAASRLANYERETTAGLLATERLVGALYRNMSDFAVFKRLSLLYFAAASFTENARRLNKPELAKGFLLHNHPVFGDQMRVCVSRACGPLSNDSRTELLLRIDEAIEPVDIAGLGDRTRRDWYPVKARDLLDAAHKLQANPREIHGLLARCGMNSQTS